MGLLDSVNSALDAVMTGIYADAVYTTVRNAGGGSDFDEPVDIETVYNCKAQINDGMNNARADGDTIERTRYVMILTSSLPIVPAPQDRLRVTPVGGAAEDFRVVRLVERDPANVYYLVEVDS